MNMEEFINAMLFPVTEYAVKPVENSHIAVKPDIIFCGQPDLNSDFAWSHIISFLELTSAQYAKCLECNITHKAYAMFTTQLHLGFDPTFLNPALSPSPLYHPITDTTLKVAWTIKVKNHLYAILGCIFASNVIQGRATSSWHVRNTHGAHFVVKDYWMHRGRRHTEEEMLNKIKGLKGVPTLDVAWMVQIDGNDKMTALLQPASIFGNTSFETHIHRHLLMTPVGHLLLEFSLLQELLSIFIDIVSVHHTLMCIYMILHHDVSINNILMYVCLTPWDASLKEEKEWEKIIQKKKFCQGLLINFNYTELLAMER
ncbi:hypothetical protein BKA83DRAFT_4120447 [Pisolithus microcarpus]|nr:hypothetical protein BKA83DRAFT_4120447 [Pisolithus microcarpus]